MFDSLIVQCPACGKKVEFQSKSGRCCLDRYTKNSLPPQVAVGMDGDVVKCMSCKKNIRIRCKIPKMVKFQLYITTAKHDYEGDVDTVKIFKVKQ